MSLKSVLNSSNSVDPDKMQCLVAFHLGLHCLPKYKFKGVFSIQRVNREKNNINELWKVETAD